ncbi:MAG: AfsR/SARP family transcriptional regulator, partial [Thermomicrobiales bacterium]
MSATETSDAHEEAPPLLRIQLLGAFRVWIGAAAIPDTAWQRGRVASLLKLLALAREHELGRNELIGRLWPDRPAAAAANNLRVTAHTLRATLQRASPAPSSRGWLVSDQHGLRLDGPVWTDVADFERAAQAGTDADAVQRAIALYTGDLLPEDPYADWAAGR